MRVSYYGCCNTPRYVYFKHLGIVSIGEGGYPWRVRADRYIMKLLYYEPLYMAENKWGFHCRYFTCMGGVLSCVIKWDPSVCGEQTRYKCCWSGGFPGKKQRMKFGLVVTPIFLLGRVKAWPLKSCMFPEVSQQKPLKNGPGPQKEFSSSNSLISRGETC